MLLSLSLIQVKIRGQCGSDNYDDDTLKLIPKALVNVTITMSSGWMATSNMDGSHLLLFEPMNYLGIG